MPANPHAGVAAGESGTSPSSGLPSGHPSSPYLGSSLSRVQTVLKTLRADGVPARDIHLPDLAAEGTHSTHQVGLTYSGAPAPMGVSDIGLENISGNITPYILNTTSAEGSIQFSNAQSFYVDGDGPDMFGVQLNSVVTNVTLFGNSTYQFWTQNYVSYTSSSGQLSFGDNIWNFSSPSGAISPNVFYETGPNGSLVAPIFYYAIGPTFSVHYPFTVSFYLNSTTVDDRPAVFFNYSVASTTFNRSGSFDFVVFNSSVGTPSAPAPVAQFQVNGEQFDPIGLVNDIELDVVGNDDGDMTTFYQMEANLSIAYWNDTTRSYSPVPSAFDTGVDTGETSNGVMVYYNETGGGVVEPVAHMIIGPSFLGGLWNVSPTPGVRLFDETLNPVNAFLFVNPGTAFNRSSAQWVPTFAPGTATTTFGIPNDGNNYFFTWLLSDYRPAGATMNTPSNTTLTFTRTLFRFPGAGVYTPLFAWGNAELAAISSYGAGTAASPYYIENDQGASIDSVFSQWNDFLFPVFPGILLVHTTASVQVTPSSFEINYPPGFSDIGFAPGLPDSNYLQLEFAYSSNVSLTNAPSISGWLSSPLPTVYPLGAVIFWNSSGNLIAGNTFYDEGASLALYGGTNNTIWGNEFLNTSVPTTDLYSIFDQPTNVTGVYESESGDLLYNNYFDVSSPAFTPTFDPLSCQTVCSNASYVDTWNVSWQPASDAATVLGTTLTGSIIQTSYQGGNFWSNYGTQLDPYGILPYDDGGLVTNGGDYVPLVPFTLYPVMFNETGLAPGTLWNVSAMSVTTSGTGSTLLLWVPNGTYSYLLPSPMGYQSSGNGVFSVSGGNTSVPVSFAPLETVSFLETGLVPGRTWSVAVQGTGGSIVANGSSNGSLIALDLAGGSTGVLYAGSASAVGYATVSWSTLVGTTPTNVSIAFAPATVVEFLEHGLPSGAPWTVNLQQGTWATYGTSDGSTIYFTTLNSASVPFNFTVSSTGFTATPSSGSEVIPSSSPIPIQFSQLPGTLVAHVQPATAMLMVDATVVALTAGGTGTLSLSPGVHSLEATEAGYFAYFNNVTISAGSTTNMAIILNPITPALGPDGTISLTVTPTTASAWVDEIPVTLSGGTYSGSATPGPHSLEVTQAGYLPYFNNVSVTSGRITSVSVSLTLVPTSTTTTTSTFGVGTGAWIAIGVLAALVLVLLIAVLVYRSQGRRPPLKPVAPLTPSTSPASGAVAAAAAPLEKPVWSEEGPPGR